MTDKKQIEEMAKSCCSRAYKTCKECIKESEKILGKVDIYECECYSYASRFFNKGYRRTIWHKIADGDFPPDNKKVLFKLAKCDELTVGFSCEDGLFDLQTYPGFYCTDADIIAWTELPKYEE